MRTMRCMTVVFVATGLNQVPMARAQTPFATAVIDFSPAPGQWVNHELLNDPSAALGPPSGGQFTPESTLVSLGGFGGSITLAFDHTVLDELLNPFGMDAIVFGNAFWPDSNPSDHWAECATIEISLDVNENGEADDPWFLIPGSHIPNPTEQFIGQTWDDDVDDVAYPPEFETWIPPGSAGVWMTQAYELPAELFGPLIVRNPSPNPDVEGIFGYAEYTPTLLLGDLDADNIVDDPTVTPEEFYVAPDDPHTVGIVPGSGGGDAFDIAWAIDPITSTPAELTGFDFIRITTAVNTVDAEFLTLEKSAEIDAVADAAPDPFGDDDEDGDIDLVDVAALQLCFGIDGASVAGCGLLDRQPDDLIDLTDAAALVDRITGPR